MANLMGFRFNFHDAKEFWKNLNFPFPISPNKYIRSSQIINDIGFIDEFN